VSRSQPVTNDEIDQHCFKQQLGNFCRSVVRTSRLVDPDAVEEEQHDQGIDGAPMIHSQRRRLNWLEAPNK
jgi:hypothetical protein